jgi:L-rhamnose mutarotase
MKRYCLALDLKDDPELINRYEEYHKAVWPEIVESIKESGIEEMEIYRFSNRLFMIMEVNEKFSFEKKQLLDNNNPKVLEWEKLMSQFQQVISRTKTGEKWVLMDKIFQLTDA